MKKVVVVGGGPAGCAAAYVLHRAGYDVVLLEASEALGGRTKQLHRDGFNLATGALFLMGGIYPRTMTLLGELGKERELYRWAGPGQLADRNGARYSVRFHDLKSFLRVPTLRMSDRMRMLSRGLALRFGSRPANAFDGHALAVFDDGEDLEQWTRRELGDRVFEYVMRPIMEFLYAVPLRELSTPFVLALMGHAHRVWLSCPPGGIGQVCEWLVERLPRDKVQLGVRVTEVAREGNGWKVRMSGEEIGAQGVILATEAFVAAELARAAIPSDVRETLLNVPYTQYAHVAIGYTKSPWPNYGADITLPVGVGEERNVAALVLHSRRHPASVPKGGEVVGVYFNTPPIAGMSDEDIKSEALQWVERIMGVAPQPSFVHLFRFDKGLTIARPGHYARLDAVHGRLPRGLYLAGDYFSQAGVEAAVLSGENAALRLHGAVGGAT